MICDLLESDEKSHSNNIFYFIFVIKKKSKDANKQ